MTAPTLWCAARLAVILAVWGLTVITVCAPTEQVGAAERVLVPLAAAGFAALLLILPTVIRGIVRARNQEPS